MFTIKCLKYTEIAKGCLQGSVNIQIPEWGLEIFDIKLFKKDFKRWISFPGREYQGNSGKKSFFPYLRFSEKKHMDDFQVKVIAAIDSHLPPVESDSYQNYGENNNNFNPVQVPF